MKKNLLFSLAAVALTTGVFAQTGPQVISLSANSGSMNASPTRFGGLAPDSRGWTDPAMNHNKLLQNQAGEGVFKQIGPYKVQGSPYLFGERHKADMYSKEAKAFNIFVSYNTYNQEVEFYSTSNPYQPLVKETGEIDSFVIKQNKDINIPADLKFIYGANLGVKDKNYYQVVATGEKFMLYKRYKGEIIQSSSNYVQSDLREFDLQTEYYYAGPAVKGLKKIKPNMVAFTKEFKEVKDLSNVVTQEAFTINPENAMSKMIEVLNN